MVQFAKFNNCIPEHVKGDAIASLFSFVKLTHFKSKEGKQKKIGSLDIAFFCFCFILDVSTIKLTGAEEKLL